jgi:hypothetical protein
VEDLERNDGSQDKPYYMGKDLMNILGKMNKKVPKEEKKSSRYWSKNTLYFRIKIGNVHMVY